MHSHRHDHSVSWSHIFWNHKLPWSGSQILSFNSRRKKTWGIAFDPADKMRYSYKMRLSKQFTSQPKEILWRNMLKVKHALILFANKNKSFILTGGKSNSGSSSWRNSKCVCQTEGSRKAHVRWEPPFHPNGRLIYSVLFTGTFYADQGNLFVTSLNSIASENDLFSFEFFFLLTTDLNFFYFSTIRLYWQATWPHSFCVFIAANKS